MIFSDLGTLAVESSRGFSAYRWIKDQLVARGVPAGQIAFMQDHKTSTAKQRLFGDVNAGRIRVLIGSSETMGTGVNAQRRMKALHHLDVPWLPSQIMQREGRIERQGNQHDEIGIYAYATLGSTDATMWQNNERKQRFINAALSGDRSVRRIEDIGSQVNQFAMAKAIASGDPRLMQKAGLEAEISRLQRQRAAHIDDQQAVRRAVSDAEREIAAAERRIDAIEQDIVARVPTRGELFAMVVEGASYTERSKAGGALLTVLRNLDLRGQTGDWTVARIGGFDVVASRHRPRSGRDEIVEIALERTGGADLQARPCAPIRRRTRRSGGVDRITHMEVDPAIGHPHRRRHLLHPASDVALRRDAATPVLEHPALTARSVPEDRTKRAVDAAAIRA